MQDDLLNQIRNFIQNFQNGPPGEDKEHEATTDTKLFSTEDIQPLPVQEPPQNFDMHQIIEECCVEASEEQKQKMEDTMLDLVKICHHKQFLCIHDDVDDLMESALDSKLLLINSINSQRLDKKEQEVKIVEEQPTEHRNHAENDDESFEDIEYVDASVPDPAIVSVEGENVVQQEEEEVDLGDISQVQDERLINLMKNDVPDNSSNDSLLEEVDLFLFDDSIPPGIENIADDP
nr:hypothetical protein [Tanacetum cinerariifolium]